MKKLICMGLAAMMALGMSACGNEQTGEPTLTNEAETTAVSEPVTEATIAPAVTEEVPEMSDVPDEGAVEYVGNSIPAGYTPDSVTLEPAHVYWQDGCLVAECYIVNGINSQINNVDVKALSFEGPEGKLAEAEFGVAEGLSVIPYGYMGWTFRFGPDTVQNYGSDLSELSWNFKCNYEY